MKPIKLTMKAFGSYANETVIDFDRLGSGLYLITGDTGAGKTTVFNGIMYALYGETSGMAKRDAQTIHSDYVSDNTDTEVTLEFETGSGRHKVERTIHYTPSQGFTPKAVLYEHGKEAIENATNVTKRCTELIGLDSNQFRNIIMLAQGEFRKFLEANSEKRGEILSKLFDSRPYRILQGSLKEAKKEMEKQRADRSMMMAAKMSSYSYPPDASKSELECFSPDNPIFEGTLRNDLAEQKNKLDEINIRIKALSENKDELIKSIEIKTADNKKLEEKKDSINKFTELKGQEKHFGNLEAEKQLLEKALYTVYPEHSVFLSMKKELKKTEADISELEKDLEAAKEVLAQCENEVSGTKILSEKIEKELSPEISEIERSLPEYIKLEQIKSELVGYSEEVKKLSGQEKTLSEKISSLEEQQTSNEKEMTALANSGELAAQVLAELEKAERKNKALSGIKQAVENVRQMLHEKHELDEQIAIAVSICSETKSVYDNCYSTFLSGQASLLADALRKDISLNGKGLCPVCGTEFCNEGHAFARANVDIPDKAAVDKAKAKFDTAEKRRTELTEIAARLDAAINSEKQSITEKATDVTGNDTTWQTLDESSFITKQLSESTEELSVLSARYSQLEQDKKHYAELCTKADSLKTSIAAVQNETEENSARLSAANRQCAELSGKLEEKSAMLKYGSRHEAEQKKAQLEAERSTLSERINNAVIKRDSASNRLHSTTGQLNAVKEQLDELNETYRQQQDKLKKAVAEAGFEGGDSYLEAMKLSDGMQPQDWLRRRNTEITNYHAALRSAEDRMNSSIKAAENVAFTDISAMQTDFDGVNSALEVERKLHSENLSRYENNRRITDDVIALKKELKKSDRTFERISRLSSIANPPPGSGGSRITFERYVMANMFGEVVNSANKRLLSMSGGRYEFEHKLDANRKNSSAGLELMIFDNDTGKARKTDSISGGEGFLASMALALGLSDTVQNHAGSIRMDSMFIDEGFGTLDDAALDKAINVLTGLADGERQIGIISHVDKLESSIDKKIVVKGSPKGSSARIVM